MIYRPVDETERTQQTLSAAGCDVLIASIDLPGAALPQQAERADVLMGATFRGGIMGAEFLSQFPNLRLVSKYTIGFDDVDLEAATGLGIAVSHCPTEANWGGVAEGALAALLALLKRVRERDRYVKRGGWRDESLRGVYLGARSDGYAGIVIGIVGLGRTGSRLAELLRPWRTRLVATDPYVSDGRFAELGVERLELDELLTTADVVSLHCLLTHETRNLIGARELGLMKRGAILINTARGALVDTEALVEALESEALAAAALDVFADEPLPVEAAIRRLDDRVLLSPHMVAANIGGTLGAAIPWGIDATLEALRGALPERTVNTDVAERWRARFAAKPLLPSAVTTGRSRR